MHRDDYLGSANKETDAVSLDIPSLAKPLMRKYIINCKIRILGGIKFIKLFVKHRDFYIDEVAMSGDWFTRYLPIIIYSAPR